MRCFIMITDKLFTLSTVRLLVRSFICLTGVCLHQVRACVVKPQPIARPLVSGSFDTQNAVNPWNTHIVIQT